MWVAQATCNAGCTSTAAGRPVMQTDAIVAAECNSFHGALACTIAWTHANNCGNASHEQQLIATLDTTGPHG